MDIMKTAQIRRLVETAFSESEARERSEALRVLRHRDIALVAWEDAVATLKVALGLANAGNPDAISVEFEWAFGISARLDVSLSFGNAIKAELGAKTIRLYATEPRVEISWPGTGSMTTTEASAKLALFTEVTALALLIEQALGGKRYMSRDAWTSALTEVAA
jgi:hypothetical protein